MPFVKASQANSHLELIKNGTVRKISGFVPDDNGDFILVVFMNPTRMSKLNQSGLGFNADMMIAGSARPKKYGKLHGNLAKGVFVHLCTKKTCRSFQHAVHLGEWAYLSEEDDGSATGDAGRLLHALGPDGVQRVHGSPAEEEEEEAEVLHGAAPASPSPDPKAKASAVRFAMDGQSPVTPKATKPAGAIAKWCKANNITEVAEAMAFNGVVALEEAALLSDGQIDALCAGMSMGSGLRMKLAVKRLREKDQPAASPEPGSGWFEVHTGKEVPLSVMRGSEALVAEVKGVAFVKLSGRWVELHKPATSGPRTSHEAPELACENGPTQVFRRAGPLEELTSSARTLLRQVGGPGAVPTDLAEHDEPLASQFPASHQNGAHPGPSPMRWSRPYSAPDTVPRTTGGRLLSEAGARPPAKSVALSVPSWQAAAIAEEWTDSGNMSFRTAVRTARWKKTENQDMADRLARHLDVAEKSGQILAQEPAAEVQLRDLAAIWWADQHPKDQETAEYFRESSSARWGTPADMWREAREFRKLSQGIKSD